MNRHLTEAMIKHIYESFAIMPSDFINLNARPLIDAAYLLPDKLRFEMDGELVQHSVWGCQVNVSGKDFKVLLGDCSDDAHAFAMVVCGKDLPTWGLFLRFDEIPDQYTDEEAMIGCSVANDKNDSWLEASTFLQASFLAGMEQLRDSGLPWVRLTEHKEEFQRLLSFIRFHTATYEGKDERQEEGL